MSKPKHSIFWNKNDILQYINSIPDNLKLAFFNLSYDGQCYAGNPKRKTNTRVSIIIPKDIANDNLKYMSNWNFVIIGIKRDEK